MAHTSNDDIRDQLIAHQIELLRFSKGLGARIRAILNRAEPDLRRRLKARLERIASLGFDPGPATTRRMQKTAELIARINRPTFGDINELIRKELLGLAIGETQFIAGVLSSSLPVIFDPLLPTPKTLRGIVFARPFERRILRDWLRTYEVNDRRRMMDEIRQGLVFDETPTQISRRIFGTAALGGVDGVREITRRGSQALAQTSMSAITNAARSAPTSTASTRAPIARASWVALKPTGPWPKMAMVSRPERFNRRNAPKAVPVPQEMAAPVSKESSSGSGTTVKAGAFM